MTWDLTNSKDPAVYFGESYSNIYSSYLRTIDLDLDKSLWAFEVNFVATSNGYIRSITSQAVIDTGSVFVYLPPIYYKKV